MVRVLSSTDVRSLVDLPRLLDVVAFAFEKQGVGEVERPPRPHYDLGVGLDENDPSRPLGTGLVMPAFIHGEPYAVTKLVTVHEDNPSRGLPTVHAQIVVTDAATGRPVAFMDGTHVTSARTGCIGGLSARALTDGAVDVAVIGSGTQARWQLRAIAAATDVSSVTVYSRTATNANAFVEDLSSEIDATFSVAPDPESAVATVDVVVTATTSSTPVFDGDALSSGTVVVAIGAFTPEMQELDATTMECAARVYADVPDEVATIGDVAESSLGVDDLVPFASLLDGSVPRENPDDIVVVESVGSAVMDAAAAGFITDRALEADVGVDVPLTDDPSP